jgi:hypothetical protein
MSAEKNNFQTIQAVQGWMTLHGKCVVGASKGNHPSHHITHTHEITGENCQIQAWNLTPLMSISISVPMQSLQTT